MKEAEVLKYEAFTSSPGKGNPAGVVLQGDDFTENEMQIIAERAGYSETSFIRKSESADLELRYFTWTRNEFVRSCYSCFSLRIM